MITNTHKKINFQIKENFEGKKETFLKIECINCQEIDSGFFNNKKCIFCFLEILYDNKNKKFEDLSAESLGGIIKNKKIILFLEYFKKLKKIKRIYKKIINFKTKNCKFIDFNCKVFSNYTSYFILDDKSFLNPILLYNFINKKKIAISEKIIVDSICKNCLNLKINSLLQILQILENSKIIQEFKRFQKNSISLYKGSNFYKYLLIENYNFFGEKDPNKAIQKKNENLVEVYEIGKFKAFQVSIFKVSHEFERKYDVSLSFKTESEKEYFKKIIEALTKNIQIMKFNRIIPLESLIEIYRLESLRAIRLNLSLSRDEENKISFIMALNKLNLYKIFPLLIDDNIEEIFLDSPDDKIYLNHQKYNRCRTEIKLNIKEIERLKTLLRLYSGQRLDFINPSIKYVIKNRYFYCRFAIDVKPVHLNDFALDIRKLNKNILTIQALLKKNTLNPLMAAFLYFCILRRINITVTGETDTGKTTLINALDLITPKNFRKIYVENVIESLNQQKFEKHQLKYLAESLGDSKNKKYSKSNYIKTLLHRTPDLIYLGEILTKEEAHAMFHTLAAGLRGFQTIHSNSVDSLINRFIYHFKIDPSCLNDLDLIILLKKDFTNRKVISISEINFNSFEGKKYYRPLFQYNPESREWDNLCSLYGTNTINKLKKYEALSVEKFNKIINIYEDIFNFLYVVKKIDNGILVDLFHKISYFSMTSINLLENFWNGWKTKKLDV